ncbi:putative baseplate assembly protein [Heliobacterium gestii]|uniref:Putative baseplate assembly protein n=1 Tax=Heliomicrobium gestii TaxID=2699 RepID=A0A845LFW2_HELGE|nr:putative baseplate assembly protein [Heliomicrobium gestii]MBM7868038.1 hypothetical protein [Heliomicrobium gestii]MZP44304.1 putative baseplate assembly protein [Heliomicrobium gestii]
MLNLPDLDDRTFDQIVHHACKEIPVICPDWTDENEHDPGITLLQMLAWQVEMQQYYLNRITARHEWKFLSMLGIRRKEGAIARCHVVIDDVPQALSLPRGTPLLTGEIPFETQERIDLLPAQLEKVIVHVPGAAAVDASINNNHGNSPYYPFGPRARPGSMLYLGFDQPLPSGQAIHLMVDGYRQSLRDHSSDEAEWTRRRADESMDSVPMGNGAVNNVEETVGGWLSGILSWRAYCASGSAGKASWTPIEVVMDETRYLTHSGRLTFRLTSPMAGLALPVADGQRRYWLQCAVVHGGYDSSPRLDQISLNTVLTAQCETLSKVRTFQSTGEANATLELDEYLALAGHVEVQVQVGEVEGQWRYWRSVDDLTACAPGDPCFTLIRDWTAGRAKVTFGDGEHGQIPGANRKIRLILYTQEFAHKRWLGKSTGLPNQQYSLNIAYLRRETFLLQVGRVVAGSPELLWEDWTLTEELDGSSSGDRHYMLDEVSGNIAFGDNERGRRPARFPETMEQDNLCILSCQTSWGSRGNIQSNQIRELRRDSRFPEWQRLAVTNPQPAWGGAGRESLEEAKQRLHRELRRPTRAVTAEDYEHIVKTIPGLAVARVKVLPLYCPGLSDYPNRTAPGQVTIVVVPQSNRSSPVPSPAFLQSVRHFLEPHRLLTTELHIIAPVYIRISIRAKVVMTANRQSQSDGISLARQLNRALWHGDGGIGPTQWAFGQTVRRSAILGALNRIGGVAYIEELWIDAEGSDAVKRADGDIEIPPHGLVFPGEHEIEIR